MWPYQIDWSATGSFWSGLGSIALAITAIYAATEWRRQYRATRITDAAVTVLAATHEVHFLLRKKVDSVKNLMREKTLADGKLSWDEANFLAIICGFSENEATRIKAKIQNIYEGGFFLSSVLGSDFDPVMTFAEAANSQVNAYEKISYFFDLRTKREADSTVLALTPAFEELLRRMVYEHPNAEFEALSAKKTSAQSALSAQLDILRSQSKGVF